MATSPPQLFWHLKRLRRGQMLHYGLDQSLAVFLNDFKIVSVVFWWSQGSHYPVGLSVFSGLSFSLFTLICFPDTNSGFSFSINSTVGSLQPVFQKGDLHWKLTVRIFFLQSMYSLLFSHLKSQVTSAALKVLLLLFIIFHVQELVLGRFFGRAHNYKCFIF